MNSDAEEEAIASIF